MLKSSEPILMTTGTSGSWARA